LNNAMATVKALEKMKKISNKKVKKDKKVSK
jgi:hypothetical protein